MAGRPALPVGSHGNITTRKFGDGYQALCRYRDADGVTRRVTATGRKSGDAKRSLQHALLRRHTGSGDDLTGDSLFSLAADQWLEGVHSAVEAEKKSPSTVNVYRLVLNAHVLPALGQLKLREVTSSRISKFLISVRDNSGPSVAKTCRTVVSGILGHAQQNDAVVRNAAKGILPLSGKPKKQPRALTRDERARWASQLDADDVAVGKDLPDLVSFMLGTGVRIGEALAVSWDLVDLEAATVAIAYTVIRVKGQGIIRKSPKSRAGTRVLSLPPPIVAMLRRRRRAGRIGTTAVFPPPKPSKGGWRDPTNTSRDIRNARGTEEFAWVTSHVFRKTAATMMDAAGMTARDIADHMGHEKVSMTQDTYLGRRVTSRRAAEALNEGTSRP
jgi:integrase